MFRTSLKFLSAADALASKERAAVFSEEGATMVEFALASILLLFVLGFVFNIGIAVWRYSVLTEAVAVVTADRAIHQGAPLGLASTLGVASCVDCNSIETCTEDITKAYIGRYTGVISEDALQVNVAIDNTKNAPGSSRELFFLTLAAEWAQACPFLCPSSLTLSTSKSSPIQNIEVCGQP